MRRIILNVIFVSYLFILFGVGLIQTEGAGTIAEVQAIYGSFSFSNLVVYPGRDGKFTGIIKNNSDAYWSEVTFAFNIVDEKNRKACGDLVFHLYDLKPGEEKPIQVTGFDIKKFKSYIVNFVYQSGKYIVFNESNIKGDFKILVLGDSQDIVIQKLNYLASKEEIKLRFAPPCEFFNTQILNYSVEGFLEYFQNKFYKITFTFPKYNADYIDTKIKSTIEEDIKPMFVKLYGEPTTTYNYPSILDLKDGYIRYCYKWVLDKKTIYIGVNSYEHQYNAKIIISDNALSEAKIDYDKQQQLKNQAKSANDF